MKTTLAAMALALCSTTALASGPGEPTEGAYYLPQGVMSYDVFEATITHVDLESCPAQFDPEVVFCRMTLANDVAHVFAFAYEGDQRLLAIKSYFLDEEFMPF